MKHFKLLSILILAIFISLPAFAIREVNFPHYWDRSKSLPKINPFSAFIEDADKALYINFSEDIENVVINISNTSGDVIYSETVDAVRNIQVTILLEKIQNGEYTLSITKGINSVSALIDIVN